MSTVEVPPESLGFLFSEAVRQSDQLSEAKASVDSRASIVIGLGGVVMGVFVGVFIDLWASDRPSTLLIQDPVSYWLSVGLASAVLSSLLCSVLLNLSILIPKRFFIGAELRGAYRAAHSPEYDVTGLRETSLRLLLTDFTKNYLTFERNVFKYNVGSVFIIVSMVFAVEFAMLQLFSPSLSLDVGLVVRGIVFAGTLVTSGLAVLRTWYLWRNTSASRKLEDQQDKEFRSFLTDVDKQLGRS